MPILMQMFWEGVTPEQYEKLHSASGYNTDTPKGAISHTSAFDKNGLHIVDLWDSESDFNSFIEKKIMPEVKRLGIKDMPQIDIYKVHSAYVPGYSKISSKTKQTA